MRVIHLLLIFVYVLLLVLAIVEITLDNLSDDENSRVFTRALENPETKDQVLYILDKFCEESIWPFAYIAASILSMLLFTVLPLQFDITWFAMTFLIIFITFYCIMGFMIYHYILPLKNYIIKSIN